MGRKKKVEVQKFGGTEKIGDVQTMDNNYELQNVEAQSKTHLEDDVGEGKAAIIRCFEFGINPQAFGDYQPTKQELFNSHFKGIETSLWKDGMKVMPEVNPRVVMGERSYKIFVGAEPMRGHILHERPNTLTELVHGRGTE